jgi:Holliday junction resolvase RusA-like endonuclease
MTVEFFVPGVPKTQGSKRAFCIRKGGVPTGRAIVVEDCKGSRDWRGDIKAVARGLFPALLDGPVFVRLDFYFDRPKCHCNAKGQVKASAPPCKTTKPDLDKLVRCVKDALTKIAWHDDAQVVRQTAGKKWAFPPVSSPGLYASISTPGDVETPTPD